MSVAIKPFFASLLKSVLPAPSGRNQPIGPNSSNIIDRFDAGVLHRTTGTAQLFAPLGPSERNLADRPSQDLRWEQGTASNPLLSQLTRQQGFIVAAGVHTSLSTSELEALIQQVEKPGTTASASFAIAESLVLDERLSPEQLNRLLPFIGPGGGLINYAPFEALLPSAHFTGSSIDAVLALISAQHPVNMAPFYTGLLSNPNLTTEQRHTILMSAHKEVSAAANSHVNRVVGQVCAQLSEPEAKVWMSRIDKSRLPQAQKLVLYGLLTQSPALAPQLLGSLVERFTRESRKAGVMEGALFAIGKYLENPALNAAQVDAMLPAINARKAADETLYAAALAALAIHPQSSDTVFAGALDRLAQLRAGHAQSQAVLQIASGLENAQRRAMFLATLANDRVPENDRRLIALHLAKNPSISGEELLSLTKQPWMWPIFMGALGGDARIGNEHFDFLTDAIHRLPNMDNSAALGRLGSNANLTPQQLDRLVSDIAASSNIPSHIVDIGRNPNLTCDVMARVLTWLEGQNPAQAASAVARMAASPSLDAELLHRALAVLDKAPKSVGAEELYEALCSNPNMTYEDFSHALHQMMEIENRGAVASLGSVRRALSAENENAKRFRQEHLNALRQQLF